MIKSLSLICVAWAWCGAALADEKPAAPPDPDAAARICESYGPGYQLVPETGICIKIDGYVDVTVGVHGSAEGKSGK